MRDYSYLEGKPLFIENSFGKIFKARVANIDYDIGITIVADQDITYADWFDINTVMKNPDFIDIIILKKGEPFVCYNGEASPNITTVHYKTMFYYTIAAIKKGHYSYNMSDSIFMALDPYYIKPEYNSVDCAFK